MTIKGVALNKAAAEAVGELFPLLTGGRIEQLKNLDEQTLLMSVYRGERYTVVISVSKRAHRVHLLSEPVRPEYLYSSVKTAYISRFLKRGRITGVLCFEEGVVFSIRGANDFLLFVDFSVSDITLADREGCVIASLLRNEEKKAWYSQSDACVSTPEKNGTPVNDRLSAQFYEERNSRLRREIQKVVKAEERKIQRLIGKLSEEDREAQLGERYRRWGELLKYNLERVPPGASAVSLQDFEGKSEEVPLDPGLSARQNMERYFTRYRKMKRRRRGSSARIEKEQAAARLIASLEKRITGEDLVGLDRPPSELLKVPELESLGRGLYGKLEKVLSGRGKTMRQKPGGKMPYRVFSTVSGKRVFVGRNASENDALVRRVARGNDLWFHAEGVSGSHVLLRYEKKGGVSENDVRDACLLALHFSRFRDERSGPVVYTFCKWVRKPKGAREGHVEYYNNKTKLVTMDDRVLDVLLGREKPL